MRHVVTVDLGFGDSGKGSIVDYLVTSDESAGTVVRYSGGPQAAHRVVRADGRSHVFAQFGAGTFEPGVRTHLARGMLVNPPNLLREWEALRAVGVRDALSRLTVDPDCVVITPWQIIANRTIEHARGDGRHGSCGQGIGETRRDQLDGVALYAHECRSLDTLMPKLRAIRDLNADKIDGLDVPEEACIVGRYPFESPDALNRAAAALQDPRWLGTITDDGALGRYLASGNVVFEAAQGVLLDERYGFHPHTTWTDTTARGAYELLDQFGALGDAETLGIVRAYTTRHGAGPLPTESEVLTHGLRDPENVEGRWQGEFRVGWLDLPLLRYALLCCPVDSLAVTCLDRLQDLKRWGEEVYAAFNYDHFLPTPPLPGTDAIAHGYVLNAKLKVAKPLLLSVPTTNDAYAGVIETMMDVPVSLLSLGPTAADKHPRAVVASV